MSAAEDTRAEWWWLSFVDTTMEYREENDYPGGPRWAGACIVPGPTFPDAVNNAWALSCNPGGEVAGFPCVGQPPAEYRGRLLSREDIDAWDAMVEAEGNE